ncbi:MAG: hypothetical protein GF401_05020 [Chitinivibrionales bacterium]|nr:hypothetical protein [Chitinivibrionales bacterium]
MYHYYIYLKGRIMHKGCIARTALTIATVVCMFSLTTIAQEYMAHTGRTHAIVNEYPVPPATFDYQHEGSMVETKNGDILNVWQASFKEGNNYSFAMASRFDGTKWSEYPFVLDDGANNYMPNFFQSQHTDNPLMVFLHLNGNWRDTETYIRTSTDNGHTWSDRVLCPSSDDPLFAKRNGIPGAAIQTTPFELPDGTLWTCNSVEIPNSNPVRYKPYFVKIPPDNYLGNVPGADPWSYVTDFPVWAWRGTAPTAILPLSDDYEELALYAGFGSREGDVVYSGNGGATWSDSWQNAGSSGDAHTHALPLDWYNSGPLRGWYVMVRSNSYTQRRAVNVNVTQNPKNGWTTVLQVGMKAQVHESYTEIAPQSLMQASDRKLHLGISGRGGKGIWHVMIDPDHLINNTAPSGPGVLNICGNYRIVDEGADVTVTVVRTGGKQGAASVSYTTRDGAAKAGSDYTAKSGTLSWDDGDDSPKTVVIPTINDSDPEGRENFHFSISNAQGAQLGGMNDIFIRIEDPSGIRQPENSDGPNGGQVYLTHQEYFAYENAIDAAIWPAIVRFSNEFPPPDVTINYHTEDGTAKAGVDYEAVSGTSSWNNQGNRQLKVPIIDNGAADGNRMFKVIIDGLTGPGATGTYTEAVCTIIDDESGGEATVLGGTMMSRHQAR